MEDIAFYKELVLLYLFDVEVFTSILLLGSTVYGKTALHNTK